MTFRTNTDMKTFCMTLTLLGAFGSHAGLASPEGAVDRDTNLGNGTLDEEILGLSSRHSTIIVDERKLLRRYLQEVERRSAVETASELAKVEFAREVFRSHDSKWWILYNDAKIVRERKERVEDYWKEYRRGENWATRVVASTPGNNSCKVLLTQLTSAGHPTDELLIEAFRWGAVSGAAECFLADLTGPLKALDLKLNDLNQKLLSAQKRLSFESPSDERLSDLSDQYRDTVATIVKEEAVRGRVKLEQLRVSYNERLEKLRPQAQMLATLVGCGADSQCSLRIENPRKNLATGLSYQILKNESSIAPFVSTVSVLGLMRAVARHLEINPHDRELIEAQRSNLEAAMSQVDVELFQQVGVIQFDFDSEINRRIRKFRKDNSKLFRGFFSQEERLGLIDYLAELKTTMKRFKTFEIGTQIETKLWDTLATNYSLALERASRMSVQAQLPTQQIVVSWDDEPAQRYLVNVAWPNMVSGYLLGDNAQDVRQWVDFLSL